MAVMPFLHVMIPVVNHGLAEAALGATYLVGEARSIQTSPEREGDPLTTGPRVSLRMETVEAALICPSRGPEWVLRRNLVVLVFIRSTQTFGRRCLQRNTVRSRSCPKQGLNLEEASKAFFETVLARSREQ